MNPREKRFLRYLTDNNQVMVDDLRKQIGALNPAQTAYTLREQGWEIKTDYIKVKDRDGKICRPGYYWMPDFEKARALKYLKKIDEAGSSASSSSKKSKFKILELINPEYQRSEK